MKNPPNDENTGEVPAAGPVKLRLQLYVSGATPRSALAIANIKAIGEGRLHGQYDLEVIDACQQGALLRNQQIVVLPTLIKHLPLPIRRWWVTCRIRKACCWASGSIPMIRTRLSHTVTIPMRTELENQALREELAELRARLNESENMLQAIRSGAVDAIVVDTSAGERFFMLHGAETPYREMVETMSEGAVTVGADGVILYSNQRFADMVKADLRTIIGSNLLVYCAEEHAASVAAAFEQSASSVPRIRATLMASDAVRVPVNMAMRCHATYGTNSIAIVISDLTKWQQAEDARERAIRALRMVNACADVIIHATDEAGMLTGVCEAIVAVDGYESIWIGPSDEVPPVSFCPFARSGGIHEHKKNHGFIPPEPTVGSEPIFRGICPHSAFALREGQIQVARGCRVACHTTPTIRSA